MKKLLLLCAIGASACSTTQLPLLNQLRGEGIQPLSEENPYLLPNLAIAKELAIDPDIAGFLKKKGAPSFVEVTRRGLFGTQATFIYPDDKEEYTLFQIADDKWGIIGPVPSTRDISVGDMPIAPTLLSAQDAKKEVVTTKPETPPPFRSKPSSVGGNPHPQGVEKKISSIVSELGYTPASANNAGDLVHPVMEGDTLATIATWYTFEEKSVGVIARINGLSLDAGLTPGSSLVIPKYLAKNQRLLDKPVRDRFLSVFSATPKISIGHID